MAASGRNSDDMNKKASIDNVLAGSDVGHDMNKKASIDNVLAGSDVGHDMNKKASIAIVPAGSDVGHDMSKASVDIVIASSDVHHMTVCDKGMSTGHAAVHVRAGQTVMLRTHGHSQGESRYRSGWITSFTGMLRQPDLYMLTV